MTTCHPLTPAQRLAARIASLEDRHILAGVEILGGDHHLSTDQRLVLTHLLAEYERRHGGEAVDALMDRLGM